MPNLEISILLPALIAGLLVIATHAPLGIQVLNRGIVFIDIAIAQIAGVGVIGADFFGWEAQGVAVQICALAAALLGALFLTWTEKRWPEIQEAIIGTVFVLAATLGVLLLASNPHGGEYLKDMLVGQILWLVKDAARLALQPALHGIADLIRLSRLRQAQVQRQARHARQGLRFGVQHRAGGARIQHQDHGVAQEGDAGAFAPLHARRVQA